jgi:sortase (surface protein transpeptidase)
MIRGGIALGVVLAVVAVVLVTVHGVPASPAAVAAMPPSVASSPATVPVSPMAQSAPTHVRVPSISASSTLIPVGVDAHNSIQVPPLTQPMQAAWYSHSPPPGSLGPAVVLGHVNGDGKPGVFADLDKVQPGQQIEVDRADGQTAVFTVTRVDTVAKDAFPTQQVYGNTPDAELRLITCGGTLDRAAHNYLSNVVVYATLTSSHPT